jgi:hypothetical protein
LVVAFLALFVALSGTSYAVSQLPAKSVGTKQLKSNAVTGAKVKDGSLRAADFRPGQLPAGPAGPTGPAGASGMSQSAGAWASRNPQFVVPPQYVEMFSLTQFADYSTGRLRLRGPSRLVLSGTVTFVQFDRTAVAHCRFEVKRGNEWEQAGLTQMFVDYDPGGFMYLPLTAVVDATSSTEDVRIVCRSDNDTTEVGFSQGSFSVVVTDR